MQPITFTQAEAQVIITMLDTTPITGIANHETVRGIVEKFQASANGGAELTPIQGGAADGESEAS